MGYIMNDINIMSRDELLNTFRTAYSEVIQFDEFLSKIEKINSKPLKGLNKFDFLIIYGLSFAWYYSKVISEPIYKETMGIFIILLIVAVIIVPCFFILSLILKIFVKKPIRLNKISKLQTKLDDKINQVANKLLLIPPQYRYPLALKTMSELVQSGRANNWEKCADKYEEQYHRWVMEKNSAESLELQRQTLQASKSAANSSRSASVFMGVMAVASISNQIGKLMK